MSFLIWVLSLTVVWLAVRGILGPFLPLRSFKFLFLPGLLVAIGARSLACGLTRTPLKSVNPPWRRGLPVEHDKPPVPVYGPTMLALLPPLVGIIAILTLREQLAPALVCEAAELQRLEPDLRSVPKVLETSVSLVQSTGNIVQGEEVQSWRTALYLYLALSVLIFAAPAYPEWKILAALLLAAMVLVACLDHLGIRAGFLSLAWFIRYLYEDTWQESLAFLVFLSLFAFLAAAVARGSFLFLKATFRPEGEDSDAKARR